MQSHGGPVPPTMANPFLYSARLTPTAVRQKIRTLLSLHDIAPPVKVQWLQSAQAQADHNLQSSFQSAISKIKKQAKAAKYPIFFDLHPIVEYAFASPEIHDPGPLLDRLLLQLRLTTLMRSVDVSNIVWGLFEHRNRFYIHTTNKNGTLATFSVERQTLQSLLVYLEKHLDYPNTTLIWYLNSPAKCMGSERITKRVEETMTNSGSPTEAF